MKIHFWIDIKLNFNLKRVKNNTYLNHEFRNLKQYPKQERRRNKINTSSTSETWNCIIPVCMRVFMCVPHLRTLDFNFQLDTFTILFLMWWHYSRLIAHASINNHIIPVNLQNRNFEASVRALKFLQFNLSSSISLQTNTAEGVVSEEVFVVTMTAAGSSSGSSSGGQNKGVLMSSLMHFLFPAHLEHPESTGRLDVFAYYGPCDDAGNLRGGFLGRHCHTDLEVRHMIWKLNRETLESLFTQPKETIATMVNELLPKAYSQFQIISSCQISHFRFLRLVWRANFSKFSQQISFVQCFESFRFNIWVKCLNVILKFLLI